MHVRLLYITTYLTKVMLTLIVYLNCQFLIALGTSNSKVKRAYECGFDDSQDWPSLTTPNFAISPTTNSQSGMLFKEKPSGDNKNERKQFTQIELNE